jgi:hypothetical protein
MERFRLLFVGLFNVNYFVIRHVRVVGGDGFEVLDKACCQTFCFD